MILLVGAALSVPWPVCAQQEADVSNAREAAIDGVSAYDSGRYVEAVRKLSAAYSVVRVPTLALYLARSLAKQGRLVEASQLYSEAAELDVSRGDSEVQSQAQLEAVQERTTLLPRIPRLTVILEGASTDAVSIEIDGMQTTKSLLHEGQLVNPGTCHVTARHGSQVRSSDVRLAEGETRIVSIRFDPAEAHPSVTSAIRPIAPLPETVDRDGSVQPVRRAMVWIAGGVGSAGFVVGSVAGAMGLKKRLGLLDRCPERECPPDQYDELDDYRRLRILSTVGFATGVAGLGSALVLLLTEPKEGDQDQGVTAWFGPAGAGVAGRF